MNPSNLKTCLFCSIVAGQSEASFVYQDDRTAAFLDIQPINPGHLLIVPIAHADNLAELDAEDGRHLFTVAQQLTAALYRSGLRCEGVDWFLADGEAAGQEVFHVHLHLIPRHAGDGFGLKFPARYSQRPPRSDLDSAAESIRSALK